METYIKYQRFTEEFTDVIEIQPFLDELIKGGWEIISYNEEKKLKKNFNTTTTVGDVMIEVVCVLIMAGKRANIVKNIL